MVKVNKRSGFTLLEILVVIIIVGVLASVAMPTLFANVERARSAEALNTLGLIKRAIESCASGLTTTAELAACDTWAEIGMQDPSNSATKLDSHFTYGGLAASTYDNAAGGLGVQLVATRVSLDGGTAGHLVTLTRSSADGSITRTGSGAFATLK